jgi:adenylate kinase
MIIILGTPGAGKTTQTRMLAEYLGWQWFSMGELVRQKVSGEERRDMLAGKIIGDKTILEIIAKTLTSLGEEADKCVWEGTPRSIEQASWWLDQTKKGAITLQAVIHLVADTPVAQKRLAKRGRLDDHDDNVIETRFEQYRKSITPTLEFLKSNSIPVHEINANQSINEIADNIHQVIGV